MDKPLVNDDIQIQKWMCQMSRIQLKYSGVFTILNVYSGRDKVCTVMKFVEHKQEGLKFLSLNLTSLWAPLVMLRVKTKISFQVLDGIWVSADSVQLQTLPDNFPHLRLRNGEFPSGTSCRLSLAVHKCLLHFVHSWFRNNCCV
jgi:hypothetical protein